MASAGQPTVGNPPVGLAAAEYLQSCIAVLGSFFPSCDGRLQAAKEQRLALEQGRALPGGEWNYRVNLSAVSPRGILT